MLDIKEFIEDKKNDVKGYCDSYGEVLTKYWNVDSLKDPKGALCSTVLDCIEVTRIKWFIKGFINGDMTIDEFINRYKSYVNKQQFTEIIERQRRSHTNIINFLCALIIEESFSKNEIFSHAQISHINFLLSLTILDLYNLLQLYEINQTNGLQGVSLEQWQSLELGESVKFKIDNGGYNHIGTISYTCGNIDFTDLYYDLMEKEILKYFSVNELKDIVKRYS